MVTAELNLQHIRAQKARLGSKIGGVGYRILVLLTGLFALAAITGFIVGHASLALVCAALASMTFAPAVWWKYDLQKVPLEGNTLIGRLDSDALSRFKPDSELTPLKIWDALHTHWQARFVTNRLLLGTVLIEQHLSDDPLDSAAVWNNAMQLADKNNSAAIRIGHIIAALLLTSPTFGPVLAKLKRTTNDIEEVVAWLDRGIDSMQTKKPYFGGIGRDWANGFTPLLNQFGNNISLGIERSGTQYGWLMQSSGVQAMKSAFSQGTSGVALVGEPGIGKTSYVHALSQLLLQESHDPNLEHRQVISLNPSFILAHAQRPGELEYIVVSLLNEAARAGHIILFLDDAQLFFSSGPGAFDATRILQPIVQSHAVQLVLAMTPHDWQQLRAGSAAFANQLSPVVLKDPPESDVMRILEDTTIGLEYKHHVLISYEAIQEAYRLSGRYEQEMAYPGKAIQLLEQSLTHADSGVITAASVQQAIEQTRGVKVGSAAPAESDTLLHLEQKIHERMINQTRAVSVVANALRRARAGVANPKRPTGSFLFLGPTGVGKTELAKAVAATYFGNEANMIRLDMSEYQQEGDVARLLSNGASDTRSLIMSVRSTPFSVILLDEIEKAHPNILNLLLQMLDEGQLTDNGGRAASFKDCVIIATSNAGAQEIRERIEKGEKLEEFEKQFIDALINNGQFKPELLNRFDEIVLFRPLNPDELTQVVTLMMQDVNQTLEPQHITVELTPSAAAKIVENGYDARLGARPMRRALQRAVEDTIAQKILKQEVHPGDHLTLDVQDLAKS